MAPPAAPPAPERSTKADTLGQMVLRSAARPGVALRFKQDGDWREITYRDLVRTARGIAKGLIALNVARGDRISIVSDTRAEWTLADVGAFCAGVVVAPVYQTASPEEAQYVLDHAEARVAICENADQVAKVESIRAQCPKLEHLVVLEGTAPGAMTLDELIAEGAGLPDDLVDERVSLVMPDDLASLVYTSGTTGPPKGCMLTHRNFMEGTHRFEERLELAGRDVDVEFFMFLPLAHVFARIVEVFTLDFGGTLIYWQRNPLTLLDDLKEARPTFFPSVPRVWEKIYTKATAGLVDAPAYKRAVFHWALGVGAQVAAAEREGRPVGRVLRAKFRTADKLALSKIRDLFGGRVELAVTAAAPIADEVLEFFTASGIWLLEAWGMTETCAAGAINTPDEMRFGTVGRPLPGIEFRVAADGELLTRSVTNMVGYYKNPTATDATFVDGWLATGDLGAIDDDGFVRITGRKKDLIITSSGKNIAPANLESALKQSRWVSEAVVFGDNRPYLVALLTLDPDEAPALAERLGIPADLTAMAADDRVHAEVQKDVDATNERFARIEQIKRFKILDHQLSQAGGELTPTLKVKRNIVYQQYAEDFARLYAEGASAAS